MDSFRQVPGPHGDSLPTLFLHRIHEKIGGAVLSRLSADDQDHAMRLEHSILSVQNKLKTLNADKELDRAQGVHRRAYLVEGELHLYKDPPANTSPKSASGIGTSAKRIGTISVLFSDSAPLLLRGTTLIPWAESLSLGTTPEDELCLMVSFTKKSKTPLAVPSANSEMRKQSVSWLFRVAGSFNDLRRLLVQMSLSGAIQGRLRDTWDVDDFLLGSGGFSVVFPGWSRRSDEIFCEVAVKLLSRRNHMSDVRNEVKYLIACRDHPNIIQFRGAFFLSAEEQVLNEQRVAENRPKRWTGPAQYALVFELFVGGDMWQFLETKGALTEHHAVRMMHGVFSALAFIHERRIIHRDVKCENIMVRDDDTAVLADFGLAMLVPEGVDIRQIAGSAGYAAPEQLSNKCRYGLKVDLFGAGVCFYRGLARAMPFPGSNKEEIIKATAVCKPDYNRIAFQSISEHMLHFLQHLISKKPNHRPSAAEALEQTAALQSEDAEVRNASLERLLASSRPGVAWRAASRAGRFAVSVCTNVAGAMTSCSRVSPQVAPECPLLPEPPLRQAFSLGPLRGNRVLGLAVEASAQPHWADFNSLVAVVPAGSGTPPATVPLPNTPPTPLALASPPLPPDPLLWSDSPRPTPGHSSLGVVIFRNSESSPESRNDLTSGPVVHNFLKSSLPPLRQGGAVALVGNQVFERFKDRPFRAPGDRPEPMPLQSSGSNAGSSACCSSGNQSMQGALSRGSIFQSLGNSSSFPLRHQVSPVLEGD
ncbi:unnamed protein product [Polarella glacialis]|uniref:Protein kinase domain-containing protein n=1 Tax=Polarella glacialis TaxID=89957 RepID=A0A813FI03_POLGL|nr:unnamed protein product [Polarella glacialis]